METKNSIRSLLKSFQEWSARNTHPEYLVEGKPYVAPITDTVAIGEIRRIFSGAKYLLKKYHETEAVEMVGRYIDFLTNQKQLDTTATIKNLQMLLDLLGEKLGIKHGFRDNIDETRPWDRQPHPRPISGATI